MWLFILAVFTLVLPIVIWISLHEHERQQLLGTLDRVCPCRLKKTELKRAKSPAGQVFQTPSRNPSSSYWSREDFSSSPVSAKSKLLFSKYSGRTDPFAQADLDSDLDLDKSDILKMGLRRQFSDESQQSLASLSSLADALFDLETDVEHIADSLDSLAKTSIVSRKNDTKLQLNLCSDKLDELQMRHLDSISITSIDSGQVAARKQHKYLTERVGKLRNRIKELSKQAGLSYLSLSHTSDSRTFGKGNQNEGSAKTSRDNDPSFSTDDDLEDMSKFVPNTLSRQNRTASSMTRIFLFSLEDKIRSLMHDLKVSDNIQVPYYLVHYCYHHCQKLFFIFFDVPFCSVTSQAEIQTANVGLSSFHSWLKNDFTAFQDELRDDPQNASRIKQVAEDYLRMAGSTIQVAIRQQRRRISDDKEMKEIVASMTADLSGIRNIMKGIGGN